MECVRREDGAERYALVLEAKAPLTLLLHVERRAKEPASPSSSKGIECLLEGSAAGLASRHFVRPGACLLPLPPLAPGELYLVSLALAPSSCHQRLPFF